MRAHYLASLAEGRLARTIPRAPLSVNAGRALPRARTRSVVTGDVEGGDGRVVRGCSAPERGKIHVSDEATTLASPSVGRHHGRARWLPCAVMLF